MRRSASIKNKCLGKVVGSVEIMVNGSHLFNLPQLLFVELVWRQTHNQEALVGDIRRLGEGLGGESAAIFT